MLHLLSMVKRSKYIGISMPAAGQESDIALASPLIRGLLKKMSFDTLSNTPIACPVAAGTRFVPSSGSARQVTVPHSTTSTKSVRNPAADFDRAIASDFHIV
ncbi:hypothetical protein [Burkholderia gladioli]|uniref:hypothetical protein n=1 Tax=Burkholderia gladioli TaxID=28095 RepID=UPI0016415900|nr:hypothetical protein [Burkholderia gladioli]